LLICDLSRSELCLPLFKPAADISIADLANWHDRPHIR
jgi:hypothetical protein